MNLPLNAGTTTFFKYVLGGFFLFCSVVVAAVALFLYFALPKTFAYRNIWIV